MSDLNNEWDNSISKSNTIDTWMDRYVYTATTFDDFKRYDYTEYPEAQNQGVDVSFTIDGVQYIADEKCLAEKPNIPTFPTFAFSLSQTNKNDRSKRHYDWLLRNDMKNNVYMIQYIDEAINEDGTPQDKDTLTTDGIKQMSLILVPKQSVLDYLAAHGLTKEKLYAANEYMLKNNLSFYPDREDKRNYLNGWRLHRDFKCVEQTVNVLIKRSDLLKMSIWHDTIRR